MSTYVTRKNRHNDPVIRRQPTSARPLHHQGLGRAGVHEPGASDTVGDLTHCSVPMSASPKALPSSSHRTDGSHARTVAMRRMPPSKHASPKWSPAPSLRMTFPSTSASSSPDSMTKVGPLTLAEQGMAGAHLKAAIPIDRKQR